MNNFRRIATAASAVAALALGGIALAGPAQADGHPAHDNCHCQQGASDMVFTTVEGVVVTVAGVV
ncbi:hypothetical protein ACWD4B_25310 [Streptomyces sp. NPDC002536]